MNNFVKHYIDELRTQLQLCYSIYITAIHNKDQSTLQSKI